MKLSLTTMMMKAICFLILVNTTLSQEYVWLSSSDGGDVMCIDILKQPAFVGGLLKDHKLQEFPSEFPRKTETYKKSKWRTTEARVSTAQCPKGKIPVRQDDLGKYSGNKSSPHEYGVGYTQGTGKLYGTRASINLWSPKVENQEGELSISQFWITSGSYETNDLKTMEVGWQVYPQLYRDQKPRLFIYSTSDAYKTGCYNLRSCTGFVQVNSSIVIGGAITPSSVFGGQQYELTIQVWKDRKSRNWWLSLGPENSLVGYWPQEIFAGFEYATEVQWGGEIIDFHNLGRHTSTQMGSGHFPKEGFGKSSYFRNIEIANENNEFQSIQKFKKHPVGQFYDIQELQNDEWGTWFFYGGPGYTHSGVLCVRLSSFSVCLCFCVYIIILFFM